MFDITIEQKTLAKALEYLEPTVGKGGNNLGENCISMKTTGNGSIEMYTTNSIEFTKLEYKLKAVQPYASKVITFEAPHFLSSLSMFPSARNLLRCYRKKHEQELNVLSR